MTSIRASAGTPERGLADPRLDRLVTAEVAFADLPGALPGLLAPGASGIATRVRY
jgi:hypothetical protein